MLRVIQTKSAAGAKSYYSQSDYLSEGQELVGRWGGKAAQMLGLSGEVDKQSFDRLCDNLDPRTGERLTLRTKSDRTVGYDFNFHLPKGASLAYALNGDERIVDALRESVDETMREIEADASTRVRKHGMMQERKTGNLAWGTFVHTTSRPVEGEPDPHVHAHCMVFNTTFDAAEQAWKAGQFRDLKRDASYYEAAFHARMANRMKNLGYAVEHKGKSWDVAGIEKETVDKFSRRTAEIEKLADELGIEDAAAKGDLGAKTRAKKEKGISWSELVEKWQSRLTNDERVSLDGLLRSQEPEQVASFDRDAKALAYAKLHCFERDSVVPERRLLAEALRHGVGEVSVEGIHAQLQQQSVITREMHGRSWATTPVVLAEETFMLKRSREGLGSATPLNDGWTIKRDWLNTDQQQAVKHVLTAPDQLIMIRGGAGTGKTSLMREAVEGIEAGGREVFTFAPSAEASRGVLASEGFKATTVAELLVSQDLQRSIAGQVIWIDEAGLLGTRTLKQVMDIADQQHARLILSGDWTQHGSVERGAAMRLLEQQAGIAPAIVRKIQRQDGAYREAVALLAEGETYRGFQSLETLGWVHEIDDAEQRYSQMAKSFANGLDAGESVLAIAPTHAESAVLTQQIRRELKSRGLVEQAEHNFERLKPLHFTEAEKTDFKKVAEGDVIVFQRSVRGTKKGTRLPANRDNAERFAKHADRFEVYQREVTQLARGDFLRITGNGKTKDGKHSLHNGQVYRIRDFNKKGDIVLNNGWVVDRDYGFLTPGYVSTSHSAQGRTVDRVLIAESYMSYPAAGQAQFYVSVSRGRKQAEIFTDDKIGLLGAILKQDERVSATELVGQRPTEPDKKQEVPRVIRHQRQQQVASVNEVTREQELVYDRG